MSDDRLLRQINARLSLRKPQEQSLAILAGVLEKITLAKDIDLAVALARIRKPTRTSRISSVTSPRSASPSPPASARRG